MNTKILEKESYKPKLWLRAGVSVKKGNEDLQRDIQLNSVLQNLKTSPVTTTIVLY